MMITNVVHVAPGMSAKDLNQLEDVHLNSSPNSKEDIDADTQCGFTSSCKPSFLQRCANVKVYLVVISCCTIIQGKYVGY